MAGIFGTDALRNLAAPTPAEQVERINAFDTCERGLITHVQGLQAAAAASKPVQPKPLRLKVHPFEGKEEENLHFWVRERWTRLSSRTRDSVSPSRSPTSARPLLNDMKNDERVVFLTTWEPSNTRHSETSVRAQSATLSLA